MLVHQRIARKFLRYFGFDLIRYSLADRGLNPYHDMVHYIKNASPVILDVGANLGESIESLLLSYPSAQIYCFEPSIESFSILKKKYHNHKSIKLYCQALGIDRCKSWFNDNEFPYMSSFLELGAFGYGNIINKRLLHIRSVDSLFIDEKLNHIDILKIDVQGSELDVLRGCSNLLSQNKISLIHVELTFTDMYLGLPNLEQLLNLLYENNFILGGIYRQHFQKGYLSWADGLFVHKHYIY